MNIVLSEAEIKREEFNIEEPPKSLMVTLDARYELVPDYECDSFITNTGVSHVPTYKCTVVVKRVLKCG